jgi:ParB family chromosome partitioning protein
VPVFVRTANDQESLEMALLENIQREDLNAIEIGMNYQRLLDECKLSHEELSERLGKKRSTISNYIRLLKLPPQVQIGVREDKITMGHARAIAGVEEVDRQLYIFNEINNKGLSVRQTEDLVASLNTRKTKKENSKVPNKNVLSSLHKKWQDTLSSNLGTKVTITNQNSGQGVISIQYFDQEELERIFEQISK